MDKDDTSRKAAYKYLIVNDRDRKYGLWVNTVGFQTIGAGSFYPLEGHPSGYFFNVSKGRVLHEYQLVYITKGKGELSLERNGTRPISRGNLLLLYPGQWHTYSPCRDTGWDEYFIGFEGAVADQFMKEGFQSLGEQVFEMGLNEELFSLFARALEVAQADKMFAQQYLAGIVLHMLGMVLSVSKNCAFGLNNMARKVEQAKIMMNESVCQEMNSEELAMKLNVSYSWFRKVFKDYTGYAPAQYFQELKLRRAKQMLVGTSCSVKEIAYSLGYASPEHFFSIFKKHTGCTPSDYRLVGRGTPRGKRDGD